MRVRCDWISSVNSYTPIKAEVFPQAADGGLQSRAVLVRDGHFLPRSLLPQSTRPGRSTGADLTALLLLAGTDSGQTGHLVEEQEEEEEQEV